MTLASSGSFVVALAASCRAVVIVVAPGIHGALTGCLFDERP